MNNFIDFLKEDPNCLYIYNRDLSIYGWPAKEHYTIIVKDFWELPEDWIGLDLSGYEIYTLSEWFDLVLKGSLIAWECACLNKKYIIKEHVKLMMTTNPLQLRKDVDLEYYKSTEGFNKQLSLLKDIRFAIQIIQNHKIVNFKESSQDYYVLSAFESLDEILDYIASIYKELFKLTEGARKKNLIDKIKNKDE